jgi:hypothetical protein
MFCYRGRKRDGKKRERGKKSGAIENDFLIEQEKN